MVRQFLEMKRRGEKIVMLTAYDTPTAKVMAEVGIDAILVGDSLGMAVLGYENTLPVTMQDMLPHITAVARSASAVHIIGDLPYKTYETTTQALKNAALMLGAGAHSVKVEGNKPEIAKHLIAHNIPVMAHVGLTPQTITDFKVQGKDAESAQRIYEDALAMEKAGCYSIVLECIPLELASRITSALSIPTIGIGAGPHCDGQVLVSTDLLGLCPDFNPKFLKKYANLFDDMKRAISSYKNDVKKGSFPDQEHSYR